MDQRRIARRRLLDLPADVLVHIASFLPFQERLGLALVCRQLYEATRFSGSSLWETLTLNFSGSPAIRSFEAWRAHCNCAPRQLSLQQLMPQEDMAQPLWYEVAEAVQPLLPSLVQLVVRWEGEAVAGPWLAGATRLQELCLYCGGLALMDVLGTLTSLKELSLEAFESPMFFESAASLPPSLTKLFAVDSHMAEVPEAVVRCTALQSLYLSRNPLAAPSLSRLEVLPRLELLSLIGCWFERPPAQLSALTSLRALYLDYNSSLGNENEAGMQEAFSEALGPLRSLEALGLSHNSLDSFPAVVEQLPRLKVLYLESNPGMARLPAAAHAVLSRLRVLSCDTSVLFSNVDMFRAAAGRLEHLYVSGSGLMWHVADIAPVEAVASALADMPALKKVTFVVQTQREEVPSVQVAQLMLDLPRRRPALEVDALDSEQFFGLSLEGLDRWAGEDQEEEEGQGQAQPTAAGQ